MLRNNFIIKIVTGFVKITGILPALIFFKPKVIRATKKLPKPCIIVSNHKSLLDFALYLAIFPFRTIRFLMAEVLYNKGKLFSTFLYCLGGIKVDRDAFNLGFVANSIEVLDNNGTLGIFPEGRLPINGKPWPFTVSAAFIATHSNAPIIPVYTDGNYGILKRATVVIGKPIFLKDYFTEQEEKERLDRLTHLLEQKVYELKPNKNKENINEEES